MPVYEARTDADFKKIVEFINSQPEDSIWNRCFRGVVRERKVEWLKFFKQQRPDWHIFYIENRRGEIQALETLEERGLAPNEPKMVTNVILFMKEEHCGKRYDFALELIREVGKWCIKQGYNTAEIVLRDFDLPFVPPECVINQREGREVSGHKIFLYQVDIQKFLGVT